ncbi:glycosyltransferase [Desulfovibrio sp. OttesenSCG-928-G11]|nr:glycosyltransferase [Desulfovibrio sp. OttesenSCG-928-G11]
MSKLLSILVPVYNVGDYVCDTVQSLVAQSLDHSLYEILLLDDASTDKSPELCRALARRHANIRVITLEAHSPGGPATVCNLGIEEAGGRYIGIVDADDLAAPSMFADLIDQAEKEKADLCLCSYAVQNLNDGQLYAAYDFPRWQRLFEKDFSSLPLQRQQRLVLRLAPVAWRKLYRRAFLLDEGLRFPEGDFHHEDHPFHWQCVLLAKSITLVDKMLITYRRNRPGQLTRPDHESDSRQLLMHFAAIRNFLLDRKLYDDFQTEFFQLAQDILRVLPPDSDIRERTRRSLEAIAEGQRTENGYSTE